MKGHLHFPPIPSFQPANKSVSTQLPIVFLIHSLKNLLFSSKRRRHLPNYRRNPMEGLLFRSLHPTYNTTQNINLNTHNYIPHYEFHVQRGIRTSSNCSTLLLTPFICRAPICSPLPFEALFALVSSDPRHHDAKILDCCRSFADRFSRS
jgi:hypothetical protein